MQARLLVNPMNNLDIHEISALTGEEDKVLKYEISKVITNMLFEILTAENDTHQILKNNLPLGRIVATKLSQSEQMPLAQLLEAITTNNEALAEKLLRRHPSLISTLVPVSRGNFLSLVEVIVKQKTTFSYNFMKTHFRASLYESPHIFLEFFNQPHSNDELLSLADDFIRFNPNRPTGVLLAILTRLSVTNCDKNIQIANTWLEARKNFYRDSLATLNSVLALLPEEERYRFACTFISKDIEIDNSIETTLELIPQSQRVSLFDFLLSLGKGITTKILPKLLEELPSDARFSSALRLIKQKNNVTRMEDLPTIIKILPPDTRLEYVKIFIEEGDLNSSIETSHIRKIRELIPENSRVEFIRYLKNSLKNPYVTEFYHILLSLKDEERTEYAINYVVNGNLGKSSSHLSPDNIENVIREIPIDGRERFAMSVIKRQYPGNQLLDYLAPILNQLPLERRIGLALKYIKKPNSSTPNPESDFKSSLSLFKMHNQTAGTKDKLKDEYCIKDILLALPTEERLSFANAYAQNFVLTTTNIKVIFENLSKTARLDFAQQNRVCLAEAIDENELSNYLMGRNLGKGCM